MVSPGQRGILYIIQMMPCPVLKDSFPQELHIDANNERVKSWGIPQSRASGSFSLHQPIMTRTGREEKRRGEGFFSNSRKEISREQQQHSTAIIFSPIILFKKVKMQMVNKTKSTVHLLSHIQPTGIFQLKYRFLLSHCLSHFSQTSNLSLSKKITMPHTNTFTIFQYYSMDIFYFLLAQSISLKDFVSKSYFAGICIQRNNVGFEEGKMQ